MSIAFVQSKSSTQASGSSLGVTFTSSLTAGNFVIVAAACDATSNTITVSDGTNTYASLAEVDQTGTGQDAVRIFYAKNVAAGSTTVTVSCTSGNVRIVAIHEFSGVNTLDVTSSSTGHNNNSQTSNNATTAIADELLFGFTGIICSLNIIVTITKETGWSLAESGVGTTAYLSQYNIVSSTGTFAATSTTTLGKSGATFEWVAEIATFYAGAGRSNFFAMF